MRPDCPYSIYPTRSPFLPYRTNTHHAVLIHNDTTTHICAGVKRDKPVYRLFFLIKSLDIEETNEKSARLIMCRQADCKPIYSRVTGAALNLFSVWQMLYTIMIVHPREHRGDGLWTTSDTRRHIVYASSLHCIALYIYINHYREGGRGGRETERGKGVKGRHRSLPPPF